MKNKLIYIMTLMMLITLVSVSAQVIQTSAPNTAYQHISMSGDGTLIIAGLDGLGYVLSNDSGNTWNSFSAPSCYLTAMNNDGSRIYCHSWVQNAILTSTDYGQTWSSQAKFGDPRTISTDDTGMKVVAGYWGTNAYISSDGGNTWTDIGYQGYLNDMSTDGQDIVLGPYGDFIRISNDGGNTWNPITILGQKEWATLKISGNGQKILASTVAEIWMSTDGGNTWTQSSWIPADYFGGSSAMSDDGSVLAIIEGPYSGSTLYVSLNDGANWFDSGMGQRWWNGIAIMDNGYIMAAHSYYGTGDGGIWLLNQTPACTENWTQINSSCNGHNYTTTYLDENNCGTTINLPTNPANGTVTNCTIPTTKSSTSGKTRYLVDANGNVVGTVYGNQIVTQTKSTESPFLSIGGGEKFDIVSWFKALWTKWFGGN